MSRASPSTIQVDCDLCHRHRTERLYVGKDYLHGGPGQWPVVRCKECGLTYTNPRPSPESLPQYYPPDYCPYQAQRDKPLSVRRRLQRWSFHYHWHYPPVRSSPWGKLLSYPIWRWAVTSKRNYHLCAYQGQGRLLDFGCGNGEYLSYMAQLGWHPYGMDFSPVAVERCRQKGLDVRVGGRPTDVYARDFFDVVTLWHVLEHVPSPTETLRALRMVLKPGGRIIIGVPNFDSTLRGYLREYWYFLDVPRHLTHFNPSTLKAVLKAGGYRLESLRTLDLGSGLHKSLNLIPPDQSSQKVTWLARQRRLCRKLQRLVNVLGQPDVMVAHAVKD